MPRTRARGYRIYLRSLLSTVLIASTLVMWFPVPRFSDSTSESRPREGSA